MCNKQQGNIRKHFTLKRAVIALGTAIAITLEAAPDVALHVWAWLPSDIKAELPPRFAPAFGVIIVVLANLKGIFGALKRKGKQNDV